MRATMMSALICATALATPTARANPLDPARVPADAKWVCHVDMDALRPTQLWQVIDDRLAANEPFQAKVGQFEMVSGMTFPRDLHDVTLYGRAAGDEAAVVLIHAKMDRQQVMAAVTMAPGYSSDLFGKYEVVSWEDDGREMFGAFHDDATLIVGRVSANVQAALDVIDAKADHIAPDTPLAAGAKSRSLVYIAAIDPASLGKPGETPNPLVKQLASGWVGVTERATPATQSTTRPTTGPAAAEAVVRATLTAKTPEAAQQLQAAAGGLKAMVGLAAMSDTADPNVKFAAAALRTMTLTQSGNAVSADVSVGVDELQRAVDRATEKAAKARATDGK